MKKNHNSQPNWLSLKTIAVAVALAGLFWPIHASADVYPRHNGDYLFWSQMPKPARVLADVKGTNDLDTAARQCAGLEILKTLAGVEGDNTGQSPWPPRIGQLYNAYVNARPDVNGRHNELLTATDDVLNDPTFIQAFLKRYFSAAAVNEINTIGIFAPKEAKPVNVQSQGKSVNAQKNIRASGTYPLHNGDYLFWPQMPEVAKVRADYQGTNGFDTDVQLTAALFLLQDLVEVEVNGNGRERNNESAQEQQLSSAYMYSLPWMNRRTDGSQIVPEADRLDADPDFVQSFLNRYFSADAVHEIEPLVPQFENSARAGLSQLTGDYPPHPGEYLFWPQMPKAARVVADMKGTDNFDTSVRQAAALDLLLELFQVNRQHLTPVDGELQTSYIHALPWANQGISASFPIQAKALRLEADPSFVEPFLKRYFSDAAVREIEPLIPVIGSNALKNIAYVDSQVNREAARQQSQQPAAQEQYSPEDREIAEEVMIVLGGVCVIFALLWVGMYLRAWAPLKMTSDSPPQFKGKFSSYVVHASTGIVGGSATRSHTSVSHSVRTVGDRVESRVSTSTTEINSFRLVDPARHKEENFELANFGLQLWEGQVASVAWVERGDNMAYLMVWNHTTGQLWSPKKPVREIYVPPTFLNKILIAFGLMLPPLWLILIPWGVMVEVQVKRFLKSGIKPLMNALDQKAEKFLQR